jgi:hypothetical protein
MQARGDPSPEVQYVVFTTAPERATFYNAIYNAMLIQKRWPVLLFTLTSLRCWITERQAAQHGSMAWGAVDPTLLQ